MKNNSILVITVPNAFSLKVFLRALLGIELVHPDHISYYTPTTIKQLCDRYYFEIINYYYYLTESQNLVKRIFFIPLKLFIKYCSPFISDGLIFLVKLDCSKKINNS